MCGIFGIEGHNDAANLTYLGLYALQHRGQESAGIVSCDGSLLHTERGMGYVADIFDEAALERLSGVRAIGHTRYSTTGSSVLTNAQPIVIRAAMKPISTLGRPLDSVSLQTRQPESASFERSDVCAVAAASCVVENVVAFEIARAMVDKFGGDSLAEMEARCKLFHEMAREH